MEEDKNFEAMYRRIHLMYDSMVRANETITAENKKLKEEVTLREAKLINCQKALDITKDIMRNSLTANNQLKDDYAFEINLLKEKIRTLEK